MDKAKVNLYYGELGIMKTIAIAGTFDSKGVEYLYVKKLIESIGLKPFTIHTGVFEPKFRPDVSNQEVAKAVNEDINEIAAKKDRALATEILSKNPVICVADVHMGTESATAWGCDLTFDYVKINADYRS